MSIKNQSAFHASIRLPLGICAMAFALLVAPAVAGANEHDKADPKPGMAMPMHPAAMSDMKAHQGMSMTGDVDYDFAMNMRRHHQMALTMSQAQLKNGKDASMRDLATKIIAAQKKEIAVIDRWIAAHHKAKTK